MKKHSQWARIKVRVPLQILVVAAFFLTFFAGTLFAQAAALHLVSQDRILILAPHPDDDILGCAGVIQSALEMKLPIQVVYLTNGDNYEWAFMAYKKRPMLLPEEMRRMGLVRHQEAVAAETLLGVPEGQMFFLGYPDWGTEHIFMERGFWGKDQPAFRSMLTKVRVVPYANAYHSGAPYKGESVLADLEQLIAAFRPTKVFVSHPADAHRDHRTFYLFTQVALWDLEDHLRPALYTYLIHYPHWPWPRGTEADRTLMPPDYFKDLVWTEQSLSRGQIDKILASTDTCGAARRNPALLISATDIRLTKLSTPRGDANRAAPPP